MNSRIFKVCVLALPLTFMLPAYAQNDLNVLVKEKKHLECMGSVVRAAPHTDHAEYGFTSGVPFMKWHFVNGKTVLDIRFIGSKESDGRWFYNAAFGGIMQEGKSPNTYGTGEIVGQWKAKCGVSAAILFV